MLARSLGLFVLCLSSCFLPVCAQTNPLAIHDIVAAPGFQGLGAPPVFSPDNRWILYTVCAPARDNASGVLVSPVVKGDALAVLGCDIWITSADGKITQNITQGQGNSWGPSWSPDSTAIAFYSDRGGSPHAWMWDRQRNLVRQVSAAVTRTHYGFDSPIWILGGRALIVKLRPTDLTDMQLGEASVTPVKIGAAGTTLQYYAAGIEEKRSNQSQKNRTEPQWLADIATIDLQTGATTILEKDISTSGIWVSPDGKMLAYIRRGERPPTGLGLPCSLEMRDLVTGAHRIVDGNILQDRGFGVSWSPNGKMLAYLSGDVAVEQSDFQGFPSGRLKVFGIESEKTQFFSASVVQDDNFQPLWDTPSQHLYLLYGRRMWQATIASGSVRELPGVSSRRIHGVVLNSDGRRAWEIDGGKAIVVSTFNPETKQSGFARISLNGEKSRMLWEESAYYEARGMDFARAIASPDQRSIAYISEATDRPSDLYQADSTFANVRRMTTLAPALSKYAFGKGQIIDYTDGYGKPSKAALLLPSNYVKGKRYPVVVWIYASTLGSNQINIFGLVGTSELNCQMYATRGYAVLFPDIPVHPGTPMRDIMKAIIPATDRLIALGIADPNRLAVAGVSNGGYSTFATIVQTDRFKAAISSVGFGNLIAMYGASEFPIGIDESAWRVWLENSGGSIGVPPWKSPEVYVRNSPVFYLNRIHTPILMEGGAIDYSIINMTDEMFTDLKTLGKDVIYLRYDGEGHGLTQEPNLVDFWNRQLTFLEEHIGTR